jgi:hypothetical protein
MVPTSPKSLAEVKAVNLGEDGFSQTIRQQNFLTRLGCRRL